MRKTSIKTLSLTLSVLLAVTVLFSLTFFAGAEAEVALGDLNGDTYVNETDIAILEAVLNGEQNAEEGVNYDISGNRMVGYEDLTVLKNMVDPSQPALADKLADGETEDILSLVASIEGAQWEKAVVRGDSTVSLAANATGTIKVLFAEAQDWSKMAKLDIDTLWVSGDRTVMVALLGADGETILGTPGVVAAQQDGWSSIYVPLTGATAKQRASVGGFAITVAEDANVFFDNFRLEEAPEVSITRADMETALVEVAWAYYLKGSKIQYDSTEFNTRGGVGTNDPLSKDYGGPWRTNTFSTLEDATTDFNLYSVCSDYCWSVYNEALGYPILGNRINAVTQGLFYNTQYPQDMAVLRWWDNGVSATGTLQTYNNGVEAERTHTAKETIAFFENWEENLRPGDIIVMHGNGGHQHAMIYVGDGKILHCGGDKYSMTTGKDYTESSGAIKLVTVEGTFLNGTDQANYFNLNNSAALGAIMDENTYGAWLVVVRPLDVLTDENGMLDAEYELDTGLMKYELNGTLNGEPLANNHPVKTSGYGITASTVSRLQYPGMEIDRTVSVGNYGTVAKGGQLTYTIKITNNSNNSNYPGEATAYAGLVVTETVPAGTAYVSNVGDGTYANGQITWNVNVAAGSSVELSYTVTATGSIGDQIVCGGGKVADIPSNVLTTTIGGEKLESVNSDFVNADVSQWNSADGYMISANPVDGTDFAERVFNEMTGLKLELPTAEELAFKLFKQEKLYQPYGLHQSHGRQLTRYMYTLNDLSEVDEDYKIYRNMLVEGYFGGVWVYSNVYNDEARVLDPNVRDLEAGDIMVYMNLSGSPSSGLYQEDREVAGWRVLVYLGNDTFASLDSNKKLLKADASAAVAALSYDMFLVLRPSQAYADLNSTLVKESNRPADFGADDGAYVKPGYVKPADPVPLSESNQKLIAALTADGWNNPNLLFATEVYKKTGISVSDGIKGAYANLWTNFIGKWNGTCYLEETAPEGYEALHTMIVYYGERTRTSDRELTAFTQLVVGDVVAMGGEDSAYLTAIYQGKNADGVDQFLVARRQKDKNGTATYQTTTYTLDAVTDLEAWLVQQIYTGSETDKRTYSSYVVLRPYLAYADINALRVRDITESKLTDSEKAALANLTLEDWMAGGRHMQLDEFPGWAYKAASVNVDAIINGNTATAAQELLFKSVGGKLQAKRPGDTGYNETYANMLVYGLYGGSQMANPARTLSAEELQVGDIFVAAKRNTNTEISGGWVYRVALYQGNSQFLITESISGGEGTAWISTTEIIGEDYSAWRYYFVLRPERVKVDEGDIYNIQMNDFSLVHIGDTKVINTVDVIIPAGASCTVDKVESSDTLVVRVDGTTITAVGKGTCTLTVTCGDLTASCKVTVTGKRYITSGILTAEEKAAIQSLTTLTNAGKNPGYVAKEVYDAADIDISALLSNQSFNDIYGYLTNADKPDYAKTWMADYTGGKDLEVYPSFTPDDLKIGDLFIGYTSKHCANCEAANTLTAVYIGNGQFLVAAKNIRTTEGCATTDGCYIDAYTDGKDDAYSIWGGKANFTKYFVLRPELLAARSITSGALTQDEMAAFAPFDVSTNTFGYVAGDAYALVGISDVRDQLKSINANNLMKALFGSDTSTELLAYADVSEANKVYHDMLIPGFYGGSNVKTGKTFDPEDLKPGDIFGGVAKVACDHRTSSFNTVTAVYLGNDTFYVTSQYCESCYYLDAKGKTNNVGATKGYSTVSLWTDDATELESVYKYYFVLRPERLAPVSICESVLQLNRNNSAELTVVKRLDNVIKTVWSSSDESVATVDANGKITAKGAGTAVIAVNCDGYKASCVVNVAADRLITSGALTAEEMAAISGLNKDVFNEIDAYVSSPVINTIYKAVGVDVSGVYGNYGAGDLFKIAKGTITNANILSTYMEGAYYGSESINKGTKIFVPADFKVGDILAANYKCTNTTKNHWPTITAVYQGDGKFLVARHAGLAGCETCREAVYFDIYDAEGNHNAEGYRSIWGTEKDAASADGGKWLNYLVLRPERLAENALLGVTISQDTLPLNFTTANVETLTYTKSAASAADPVSVTWSTSNPDVATVDQNGNVTIVGAGTCTITVNCDGYTATCQVTASRSIADRTTLTATEQAAISALTSLTPGKNPGVVAKEIYNAVDIDVSAVLSNQSFNAVYSAVSATTASDHTKILVAEYTGGKDLKTYPSFKPDDLKIGDLFMAYIANHCDACDTANTLTGVYIGNGQFLIADKNTCTTCGGCYIDAQADAESNTHSVWGDKKTFSKYFILRPSNLAMRYITEGALTTGEMEAIAAYATEKPGTLAQIANGAYENAGILTYSTFGKTGVGDVRGELLVDSSGALIEGDTAWHKMLVEGSNGGSANKESTKTFTQEELQIGDIFCAIGKCEHSMWVATTAIYQGNGKFFVSSFKAECECHDVYVDDISDMADTGLLNSNGRVSIWAEDVATLKSVWKHYFVLRPSQLAQ